MQTTLGKLYASWRRVQRADNPEAYARKVLMRTYLSHVRKRSSGETPRGQLPESPAADSDQELWLRWTRKDPTNAPVPVTAGSAEPKPPVASPPAATR